MYESILVPTDGSDGAAKAVEHAIELANWDGAALHTAYVVSTRDVGADASEWDVPETLEEAAEAAIDDVIDRAEAADVDTIEATIARGVPYRAILDYVDEHDIDLVVMGTHGRTGLDRYLLGSVTERVVRMADVPVLAVPMGGD
jgi:nucleotide-binding universal stress UspA family protein